MSRRSDSGCGLPGSDLKGCLLPQKKLRRSAVLFIIQNSFYYFLCLTRRGYCLRQKLKDFPVNGRL